jgi:mono/diheme cytochrome c family protein
LVLAATACLTSFAEAASTEISVPSFSRTIAPILSDHCITCHGAERSRGGYRLDTYSNLMQGGDSDKRPITPGTPEASHLFELITAPDPDARMPQKGAALDGEDIDQIRRWILSGAVFDGAQPSQPLAELARPAPHPAAPSAYPHPIPVAALVFLSDNQLAVAGYHEATVWSRDGELMARIGNLPERVYSLRSVPEHRRLIYAGGSPGRSGEAGMIPLGSNQPPRVLCRTADTLLAAALNVHGDRIAVAGADRGIFIFECESGDPLTVLNGHAEWVLDVAFSPDGKRLASASRDGTARVFEVDSGAMVCAFRDHNEWVTAVVFLNDGKRVASVGRDGRVRIWDAATGRQSMASKTIHGEASRLLAGEDTLLSAWTDGVLREHNASDLRMTRELTLARDRLLGLCMQASTGVLAAGAHDGRISLLDLKQGREVGRFLAAPGID